MSEITRMQLSAAALGLVGSVALLVLTALLWRRRPGALSGTALFGAFSLFVVGLLQLGLPSMSTWLGMEEPTFVGASLMLSALSALSHLAAVIPVGIAVARFVPPALPPSAPPPLPPRS